MRYHFIHVSKTGGTGLRDTLKGHGEPFKVIVHGHGRKLRDIPDHHKAFFVVRDPVERFVSGFNSRLRKGQPRRFHDWNEKERKTFTRFASARELANGLAAGDPVARTAMDSMIHTRRAQSSWLGSVEEFETMIPRIAFVGHLPNLTADFELLRRVLGLGREISLPTGKGAHATPAGYDVTLDDGGRAAVKEWYKEDYPLYHRCLELRKAIIAKIGVFVLWLCAFPIDDALCLLAPISSAG